MNLLRSRAIFALPILLVVVACGGGGGGGGGTNPIPGATPTPVPTATPTPAPVADSTAAATLIADDPNTALGNPATINTPFPNTGRPDSATIDTLACGSPGSTQHFHAHISVFNNGSQVVVPGGIGMFKPTVVAGTYFEDPGTGGCAYDIHTHSDDAIMHIESSTATQTFNLQQFFDLWGQPLTANGFGPFVGTTRVFTTDESTGTAGSYTVTEVTGNLTAAQLKRHFEYTVEVGPTFVSIPNYTWGAGF